MYVGSTQRMREAELLVYTPDPTYEHRQQVCMWGPAAHRLTAATYAAALPISGHHFENFANTRTTPTPTP